MPVNIISQQLQVISVTGCAKLLQTVKQQQIEMKVQLQNHQEVITKMQQEHNRETKIIKDQLNTVITYCTFMQDVLLKLLQPEQLITEPNIRFEAINNATELETLEKTLGMKISKNDSLIGCSLE
uniref:Uncharacterized protein n=1 Tax=Anopheles albimanus TaxID=7167 RepID=A0A182FYW8_ANOAL